MKVRKVITINEARKILENGGKLYIRVNENVEQLDEGIGKLLGSIVLGGMALFGAKTMKDKLPDSVSNIATVCSQTYNGGKEAFNKAINDIKNFDKPNIDNKGNNISTEDLISGIETLIDQCQNVIDTQNKNILNDNPMMTKTNIDSYIKCLNSALTKIPENADNDIKGGSKRINIILRKISEVKTGLYKIRDMVD